MGHKNQWPVVLNWQATNPQLTLLPQPANMTGTVPSGNASGTMSGTNTIYSQIMEISRADNCGLELSWTGSPTGVLSIMVSNSGVNFYALTFNPALIQPAAGAGGVAVNLNQLPFKFLMVQYTNTSGTGVLTCTAQFKDLN
jgi:hypothetical protein